MLSTPCVGYTVDEGLRVLLVAMFTTAAGALPLAAQAQVGTSGQISLTQLGATSGKFGAARCNAPDNPGLSVADSKHLELNE